MKNLQINRIFLVIVTLLFVNMSTTTMIQQRILVQLSQKDIRNLIQAKIQQKTNVVNQRYAIVNNIANAADQVKALKAQLITAKIAGQNAYTAYYNAKMKCDGLAASSNTIGIKGQISDQVCLQFPIAAQALNLYTLKLQLQGYTADTAIAQKAFNFQTDFLADAAAELAIYQDLLQYFSAHYNKDLYTKWNNQILSFTNFYNIQKNVGASKKQILDGAKAIQSGTATNVQAIQNQVTSLLTTCNSNLSQLKTTLNQSLAVAANLNTQIKTLQNNIAQWLTQTGPKIDQLKKLTTDLSALVSQYAAAVGATV